MAETFNPAALGYEEVGDAFDPASLGYEEVPQAQSSTSQPIVDILRRVPADAARAGLNALAMTGRIAPPNVLGEWIAEKVHGVTKEEALREVEGAAARSQDEYGVDPKYNNTIASAVASGVGQIIPTIASGPMAPIQAALTAGEQGYQEATEYGATGAKLAAATGINAGTAFVTEKLLGIPKVIGLIKANKNVPFSLWKTALKTAGMEGTQEIAEEIIQDLAAKGLYDPNRKLFDVEKLAKVGLVGILVGGPVGATLQAAENLSKETPQTIAPRQEMQDVAQAVDESLAKLATETPQFNPQDLGYEEVSAQPEVPPTVTETNMGTPVISPEEIKSVPEGTPQELQESVVSENIGPRIIGTGIRTPEGIATGQDWNTKHADIIKTSDVVKTALDQGMEIEELDSNKGFVVEENGKQRFVGRKEALEIARKSGQVDEGVLYDPDNQGLISEALIQPQNAQEAATEILKHREKAVQAAKDAGAAEPDLIADQAIDEMRAKASTDPALLVTIARRRAIDQARGSKGAQPIEESTSPVVERGPMSELVSQEDFESLDQAVEALPEIQRNIIRTLEEEPGLTNREVGERLGMTVDQVKKAKVQYRKTMLDFAKKQGIGARLGPGAANIEEALAVYELRRFGQRFQESEEIDPEIRRQTGDRYYEPIPNRVTAQKATELIAQRGEESIQQEITDLSNQMSFADRVTVGQILIKRFNEAYKSLADKTSEAGRAILDKAVEVTEKVGEIGTEVGRGVQAFVMWNNLTAEGKLLRYQRKTKKAQDDYTRNNRTDIDQIKDTLNGATKESATKASGSQKVKVEVATAKRGTGADKPIWDKYKEDLSKRMASLLPGEVPVKERGPLEKFTNQVFQLFKGKVSEPSEPKTKPPNIVRVRQMISEWSKLKEAWREAWIKLRDTDVAEHRAYIDKVSNYLDAPFTEGDIRSVMREMPIFSPSRLGQLSESSGRTAAKELADVLLDENPNATKEMRGKIEDYAHKIIESERSKYQEAKAKAEAAKKEKGKPQPKSLDRDVWVQYQQQAIKNIETALFSGKPQEQPALQEFTNRLVAALKGKIPAKTTEPKTAQEKKAEDIRVVREAMTNREKYEDVWTNTTNALKLKYGNRPDILTKIDEVFAGGLKNPLNPKTLQSLIRERIKSDEIKLSELVRRHYSKAEEQGKLLADKISEELGLDESGSREVASAVESEFSAEVTKAKARALASLVKTNPTAKKLSKTDAQKLIEVSNLGALTDKTFYDAVSKSLGLPGFTPEIASKILDLANKIDEAAEGMPKMEATLELNKFLAQKTGYDPGDLFWGYYYGNILSGTGTQMVNLVDTSLNVLNESVTLAIQNPRAAARIFSALAKGAASGRYDALMALTKGRRISDGKFVEDPFFMEIAEFGKKGGVPLKTDTAFRRTLKRAAESKLATPLNAWKYVGRVMSGADALAFRAAQEAKAAQLADRLSQGENIDSILGYDRLPEFRQQAESEGYTGAQAEARATELMLMSRPEEIQKASTDFASESTYNVKPYGIIGTVSNSIESAARKIPPLKLIVPFTRIVGNVLNRNLNNTPYGYYRAIRGKSGTKRDMSTYKEYTLEERQALLVRATVSAALLTAMGALHALGYIEISGGGPADPEKKKQLRATGWKPYTIRIGDRYFNYAYLPASLGISVLGNWLDMSKYKDFGTMEATDRLIYSLQAIAGSLMNQSFLTNLGTFWEAFGKNQDSAFAAMKRLTANTASALVPASSLLKDIEEATGSNVPKSKSFKEATISQIPFASQYLKPQLNAFGREIKVDRSRFETQRTSDPAWKVVIDKDLRVPVPNTFFDDPSIQYEYFREQGQAIEKWVLANESRLRNMDNKNAQDALENASDSIRKRVRSKYLSSGNKRKKAS